MAKDECMQFLANNTDVEWSAFGFSDGTNKLFTSHCRFKEYGGSDFIQIELGPYSLITHCDVSKDNQQANGWSLQMSSKTNSLTMFDHIHPRGGKTMPSESDKRLVADLRIKYPNMAASIILPEKIPLSY